MDNWKKPLYNINTMKTFVAESISDMICNEFDEKDTVLTMAIDYIVRFNETKSLLEKEINELKEENKMFRNVLMRLDKIERVELEPEMYIIAEVVRPKENENDIKGILLKYCQIKSVKPDSVIVEWDTNTKEEKEIPLVQIRKYVNTVYKRSIDYWKYDPYWSCRQNFTELQAAIDSGDQD